MSDKENASGIGLGTLLFLIFLVLKLTGSINWSWWWVTSPLWIPLGIIMILLLIIGLITLFTEK